MPSTKPSAVDLPQPSPTELEILKVLWSNGRLSIREVHDRLSESLDWAYSTTKTMMDRMLAKGLLEREKFHGVFLYRAVVTRAQGLARLIRDFSDRVLEMDHSALVPLFADSGKLSATDIEELEVLLDQVDDTDRSSSSSSSKNPASETSAAGTRRQERGDSHGANNG